MQAWIENLRNGRAFCIPFPDEDLSTAITDLVGEDDWECIAVMGDKKDGVTEFQNNSFHKCDMFELNSLMLYAMSNNRFDEEEDYAVINLLLEDRNYDAEDVENLILSGNFKVYRGVEDMGDVAKEYLDNTSHWYSRAKEMESYFDRYFDFKSYGEEVLGSSGNFLQDKKYKIIIEVFD